MDLVGRRATINRLLNRRKIASESADREASALASAEASLSDVLAARDLVQGVAQAVQRRAHERIASVAETCLNAVFDDPYGFRIEFDRKRGRTEARMVFSRDGVELDDPLNEVGGGVVDVAALALRLACVLMAKPALRKMLILDEPFCNVQGERLRERTCEQLRRLSEEMKVQVVLNTDVPAFRMGTVVEM